MIIPDTKNLPPILVAHKIVGVQPMAVCESQFTLRRVHEPKKVPEGAITHTFGQGFTIRYGEEDIPLELWWKIKIAGL